MPDLCTCCALGSLVLFATRLEPDPTELNTGPARMGKCPPPVSWPSFVGDTPHLPALHHHICTSRRAKPGVTGPAETGSADEVVLSWRSRGVRMPKWQGGVEASSTSEPKGSPHLVFGMVPGKPKPVPHAFGRQC